MGHLSKVLNFCSMIIYCHYLNSNKINSVCFLTSFLFLIHCDSWAESSPCIQIEQLSGFLQSAVLAICFSSIRPLWCKSWHSLLLPQTPTTRHYKNTLNLNADARFCAFSPTFSISTCTVNKMAEALTPI